MRDKTHKTLGRKERKKGTVCAHKDSVEVSTMARSKVSRVNVVIIAIENAAQ